MLSKESKLQRAAKRALEKLVSRQANADRNNVMEEPVSSQAKEAMISSNYDNPFIVDFEAISPIKTTKKVQDHTRNQSYGNTLFDHLCAMSTKLYEKR